MGIIHHLTLKLTTSPTLPPNQPFTKMKAFLSLLFLAGSAIASPIAKADASHVVAHGYGHDYGYGHAYDYGHHDYGYKPEYGYGHDYGYGYEHKPAYGYDHYEPHYGYD